MTPQELLDVARKLDDAAHTRQNRLLVFLFLLPLFWGIAYGAVWGAFYLAMH